jgi:hypothetical protein
MPTCLIDEESGVGARDDLGGDFGLHMTTSAKADLRKTRDRANAKGSCVRRRGYKQLTDAHRGIFECCYRPRKKAMIDARWARSLRSQSHDERKIFGAL